MNAFLPADILMPKTDAMEKWAVIACDQFTSDQAYWDRVRKNAEGAVSTINLILPEAELGTSRRLVHPREIDLADLRHVQNGSRERLSFRDVPVSDGEFHALNPSSDCT